MLSDDDVHAICRECWTRREGLRVPVCAPELPPEPCCFCGAVADEGIYVREGPAKTLCGGRHKREPGELA